MSKALIVAALTFSVAQAVTGNNQGNKFGIASWNMQLLNYYVVPGIVAGLTVFLFVMLIVLFALC